MRHESLLRSLLDYHTYSKPDSHYNRLPDHAARDLHRYYVRWGYSSRHCESCTDDECADRDGHPDEPGCCRCGTTSGIWFFLECINFTVVELWVFVMHL